MSTLNEGVVAPVDAEVDASVVAPISAPVETSVAATRRAALGAPPLGSGRTADVYAWQPGWVLKLFRTDVPRPYADREARSARAVYEAVHGEADAVSAAVSSASSGAISTAPFSVPVVGATLTVGARTGLLYAYADGAPLPRAELSVDGQASGSRCDERRGGRLDQHLDQRLGQRIGPHLDQRRDEHPGERLGERLADLHLAIHRIDPRAHRGLDALPDQRDWLRLAVETARDLPPALRSALLHELHALDYAPDSLCHGDFHPYNVLQQPNGAATVIDWVSAARGEALCDVAKTAIRLRFAPAAGHAQIAPAHLAMRRAVHDAYLRRYCERYSGRGDEPQHGGHADADAVADPDVRVHAHANALAHANASADTNATDLRALCERWLPLAAAARLVEGVGMAERTDLLAFIERRLARATTGSAP